MASVIGRQPSYAMLGSRSDSRVIVEFYWNVPRAASGAEAPRAARFEGRSIICLHEVGILPGWDSADFCA